MLRDRRITTVKNVQGQRSASEGGSQRLQHKDDATAGAGKEAFRFGSTRTLCADVPEPTLLQIIVYEMTKADLR